MVNLRTLTVTILLILMLYSVVGATTLYKPLLGFENACVIGTVESNVECGLQLHVEYKLVSLDDGGLEIIALLSIVNVGKEERTFHTTTSQLFDIIVKIPSESREVKWSDNKFFLEALQTYTLLPGEELSRKLELTVEPLRCSTTDTVIVVFTTVPLHLKVDGEERIVQLKADIKLPVPPTTVTITTTTITITPPPWTPPPEAEDSVVEVVEVEENINTEVYRVIEKNMLAMILPEHVEIDLEKAISKLNAVPILANTTMFRDESGVTVILSNYMFAWLGKHIVQPIVILNKPVIVKVSPIPCSKNITLNIYGGFGFEFEYEVDNASTVLSKIIEAFKDAGFEVKVKSMRGSAITVTTVTTTIPTLTTITREENNTVTTVTVVRPSTCIPSGFTEVELELTRTIEGKEVKLTLMMAIFNRVGKGAIHGRDIPVNSVEEAKNIVEDLRSSIEHVIDVLRKNGAHVGGDIHGTVFIRKRCYKVDIIELAKVENLRTTAKNILLKLVGEGVIIGLTDKDVEEVVERAIIGFPTLYASLLKLPPIVYTETLRPTTTITTITTHPHTTTPATYVSPTPTILEVKETSSMEGSTVSSKVQTETTVTTIGEEQPSLHYVVLMAILVIVSIIIVVIIASKI